MALTKRLAARKMPKHVRTLDDIAHGKSFSVIAEKCPQCGFEPKDVKQAEPTVVKPSDQVRAITELRKMAEGSEMIITSENAGAFFDCVSRAIKEVVEPHQVDLIHDRARELFKNSRKAS